MVRSAFGLVPPRPDRRGRRCRALAATLAVVLVAAAFALPPLLPATASAAGRTVRVGIYDNEPKEFLDKDGKPAGIFVDLMKEIAAQEGWTLVWVPGTFSAGLSELASGTIDVMPDVAYTAERDKSYDFHKTPVVESWSYVYAAPGRNIERVSQLAGKRVAVLKGSIQEIVFKQMTDSFGMRLQLVPVDSLKEAFRLASIGNCDAAIANYYFGDYFYKSYRLQKTPIVFNPSPAYYVVAQGRNADILRAIDRHLGVWIQQPDSVYYTILSRYTATEKPAAYGYILWALGIIGGLLAIATVIILLLRWQVGVRTRHLDTALAELRESEAKYRRLVEGSPDMVYSVSDKRGGLYHSRRVEAVLGYTPEYLAEHPFYWVERIHPDDRAAVDAALEAAKHGEPVDMEYRIMDAAGQWHWLRDRSIGSYPEGDEIVSEGVATDITARKLAEEAKAALTVENARLYEEVRRDAETLRERVAERTAQLEEANRELEAFSYSVSHDLRAPLRHISGYVDLLVSRSQGELTEKTRHYLDSIAEASHQMGVLIDDLLAFSRTSRTELRMGDVDMDASVQHAIASLRDDVAGREIEWTVPPLPKVFGDMATLQQVWGNLLDNAVKYTRGRSPATIEIGSEERPDETEFWVRDNGAGFDMRYAGKLFGVFQRLHSSDQFEGTGVGLANVRRIVERHGGRTWAEAEPDKGATIHFSIPTRKAD